MKILPFIFLFYGVFINIACRAQAVTGEITDCSDCKPKIDTAINNSLTIVTRENTYAVVKLIENGTGACIRYIFINKDESYEVKNIPKGNYIVKFALGLEWDEKKKSSCKLRFKDKKPLFMKIAKPLQFKKIHKGDSYEISSYTINLGLNFSESNVANKRIESNEF